MPGGCPVCMAELDWGCCCDREGAGSGVACGSAAARAAPPLPASLALTAVRTGSAHCGVVIQHCAGSCRSADRLGCTAATAAAAAARRLAVSPAPVRQQANGQDGARHKQLCTALCIQLVATT